MGLLAMEHSAGIYAMEFMYQRYIFSVGPLRVVL